MTQLKTIFCVRKYIDFLQIFSSIVSSAFKHKKDLTNHHDLKILFLVPLYHTNMLAMVESLTEAGHEVAVVVAKTENIENYKNYHPILFESSTSLDFVLKQLPFSNPQLVLIRDQSPQMIALARHFQDHGSKTVNYNQKPLRRQRGYKGFIKDLKRLRSNQIKGLPLHSVTPVDNVPHIKARWPKKLLTSTFNFPVYNYPNAENRDHSPVDTIEILLVGKMAQPLKRHFWLIRALQSSGKRCNLNICGSGLDLEYDDGTRDAQHYWKLREESQKSLDSGKITINLHESVDFYDLSDFYAKAEIFVLPSFFEEFGISVLEAMAHSSAIVVSDACGVARHVENEKDGFVFASDEYEAFEQNIHRLLGDPSLRKKMQTNAEYTARTHHNYKQFVRFIEGLLES